MDPATASSPAAAPAASPSASTSSSAAGRPRFSSTCAEAGLIDTAGAGRCALPRRATPAPLVGRPRSWADLPRGSPRPAPARPGPRPRDRARAAGRPRAAAELRRHPRIALQLPVELFCAGRAAGHPAGHQPRRRAARDGARGLVRRPAAGGSFDILGLAGPARPRDLRPPAPAPCPPSRRAPAARQLAARFTTAPLPSEPGRRPAAPGAGTRPAPRPNTHDNPNGGAPCTKQPTSARTSRSSSTARPRSSSTSSTSSPARATPSRAPA